MSDVETEFAVLVMDAELELQQNRPDVARTRLLSASELAEALPDPLGAHLDLKLGALLRRAGAHVDAAGVLVRAGLRFEALGDPMQAGTAHWGASLALEDADELPAAIEAAERAAQVFEVGASTSGTASRVGPALTNAGRLNQWAGRLPEAVARYEGAVPWLDATGDPADESRAMCEQGWGESLYRQGAYAAAIPHLRRGVELFASRGRDDAVAAVLSLLASALDLSGDTAGAADAARDALAIAERVGLPQIADRARHLLAWNNPGSGSDDGERALDAQRTSATGVGRADLDWDLAILRRRKGDLEGARACLEGARQRYDELGNGQRAAACDVELARLDADLGDRTAAATRAERTVVRCATAGWRRVYIDASTLLAELIADDDPAGAVTQAWRSVAVADDLRVGLDFNEDRERWASGSHNEARAVALGVTHRCYTDPWAMAELIESARVQATTPDETVTGCVAVGGESRLHTARQTLANQSLVVAPPDPVPLEEIAEAVGGAGAWWLGSWVGRGEEVWTSAVRRGQAGAGPQDASTDSSLLGVLGVLYRSLPFVIEGETRDDFDGRMLKSALRDPQLEPKLAGLLGRLLIPEHLREHLRTSPTRVPVVVAPCFLLSWVPWGLLALDDSTRLIERADVLLAPPVTILAHIDAETRAGRRLRGGPGPVLAAVADPDGTLPAAASLGRRLSEAGLPVLAGTDATPQRLAAALRGVDAGMPGTVVVACHARVGEHNAHVLCLTTDERVQACPLAERCCGGAPISAATLFGGDGPRLPGRVLLAACDSSGGALAGNAGEWFGLAPAALSAGARLVVASVWPVLDNEPSAAFEAQVIETLTDAADPVGALHDLGCERLDRWRAGDVFAAPLFWASYASAGFRDC